jgi:hypothetical protein
MERHSLERQDAVPEKDILTESYWRIFRLLVLDNAF